jgi:hypothetical protein
VLLRACFASRGSAVRVRSSPRKQQGRSEGRFLSALKRLMLCHGSRRHRRGTEVDDSCSRDLIYSRMGWRLHSRLHERSSMSPGEAREARRSADESDPRRASDTWIANSPSRGVHTRPHGPEREAFNSTGVHDRPHLSAANGSQLAPGVRSPHRTQALDVDVLDCRDGAP